MNLISETLPSKLEIISDFVQKVLKKLADLKLNESQLYDIRLCLSEALVNAIKHGNKLDPGLKVRVAVDVEGDRLIIRVHDEGKGFDPEALPDPTEEPGLERACGRGVFLIRKLMDECEYLDRGRVVKMVKFLKH